MTIPRATARLQLHQDFTFDDATAVVDYYAELGISHFYVSPILTARSGSTHGYDTVDPTQISPALGGMAGLRRLVSKLRVAGMGLILDIVPNHMSTSPENPWWQHVLEWGRTSPYAGWFDIDWNANDPALRGKMLAPFLGQPYGEVLASGELRLDFAPANGRIYLCYFDHRFPLAPECYPVVLQAALTQNVEAPSSETNTTEPNCLMAAIAAFERIATADSSAIQQENAQLAWRLLAECLQTPDGVVALSQALVSFDATTTSGLEALHDLLERQHYRLTWWRNAAEEINWRRFFEVSDLAGVRVEEDSVFDATHALIFQLYTEGLIDGLRIDHVDGLADPAGYCRKLRQRLEALTPQRARSSAAPFEPEGRPYLIVEKILAPGEHLRRDWGIDGTTGYEFMDQVGALLHDPAGAEPLSHLRADVSGTERDFAREVRAARRQLLAENLVGEFDATARVLHSIARADLHTRDYSLASIRRALTELLLGFPVYRTYAGEDGRDALDEAVFQLATQQARQHLRQADWPVLDVIGQWLGGVSPHTHAQSEVRNLCRRVITRFQQLTPPLAAKSVEDTAFYRYGRLLSRNEVGADPGQFSLDVAGFHQACVERSRQFPDSLLATATHDHKRGEDLRARLATLSEVAPEWASTVQHWMHLNTPLRAALANPDDSAGSGAVTSAPHPDDELMLYQMLVGAWPLNLQPNDAPGLKALAERLEQWQTKALREAKNASSWAQPNEAYEVACCGFLMRLLEPGQNNAFLPELTAWIKRIAAAGAVNGLTQTLLRLTVPGVPDLYQGTEFWDFSLVDPDNRRPVDYAARRAALASDLPAQPEIAWRDGQLKQRLIQQVLLARKASPHLFARGNHLPLSVTGEHTRHVIAFMREARSQAATDSDTAQAKRSYQTTDKHDHLIAVATLLPLQLGSQSGEALAQTATWGATCIALPDGCAQEWVDILTGKRIQVHDGSLRLEAVLHSLPVALLVPAN